MATKADLERRLRQLEAKARADAKLIESLRNEAYDLRWQLGLNSKPEADEPFDPPGHIGVPGYVQDFHARIKAELAAKTKGKRHA